MADLTEEQKKALLNDIIINYYFNNPVLYDKMEDRYVFTIEKYDRLNILSNYLKDMGINKSVPEIADLWKNLVRQFKKCLAAENAEGSGSGTKEHDFPYYEHLLFLKPSLQHRTVLSTISLSCLNSRGLEASKQIASSATTSSHASNIQQAAVDNTLVRQSCNSSTSNKTKQFPLPSNTFTTGSNISMGRKVPEYDGPAKKKLKMMAQEDQDISNLRKQIVQTLDKINHTLGDPKLANKKDSEKSNHCDNTFTGVDYKKHLKLALSKIPEGYEDECMANILSILEEFDKHNENLH